MRRRSTPFCEGQGYVAPLPRRVEGIVMLGESAGLVSRRTSARHSAVPRWPGQGRRTDTLRPFRPG
jgi:hypothetical protein